MAVPDYQSLMLPLLTIANDRQEHSLSEVIDVLALQLGLTDDDRRELLPMSGAWKDKEQGKGY